MAKANMTVELSPRDRKLLRDVVDAIRSLKPEEQVPESKTRLVEGGSVKDRVEAIGGGYTTGAPKVAVNQGSGSKLPNGRIDITWD